MEVKGGVKSQGLVAVHPSTYIGEDPNMVLVIYILLEYLEISIAHCAKAQSVHPDQALAILIL